MNGLSTVLIISAAFTLVVIMGIGVYSGKKVKDAKDFDTGGKSSGSMLVTGTIIGTLVGGSSTIGTAQLAFKCGLSAWWFTIGSSLGCLILVILCKPIRNSNSTTIQEIIRKEYGESSGVITSVLATVGIILNIVAQILSANALLTTMFGLDSSIAGIVTIIIMACYVVFGGVKGTGILGIVKLVLIYLGVTICGITALVKAGGISHIYATLPHAQYFNFFARGAGIDIGAFLSVALGVVSTQTYIQAIVSAKSHKDAKKGALISFCLIPPIGLLAIFVGYFMRINFPAIDAGQAFPQFIIQYMPPAFAGVIIATLMIAVVGTGSGMALGFGTIFTNDIYIRFINKNADSKKQLLVTRVIIIISLIVSVIFTNGNLKSAILTWGFMSMGLRAVVLLVPMCMALYKPGSVHKNYAIASSCLGLIAMMSGNMIDLPFDALFLGLGVSLIIMMLGYFLEKAKISNVNKTISEKRNI